MRWSLYFCVFLTCFFGAPSGRASSEVTYQFKGVNTEQLQNIQARLALRQQAEHTLSLSSTQVLSEIRVALQPFGYFKSVIRSNGNTYYINLGPPLIVKQTDLKIEGPGEDNAALQEKIAHFPLKTGSVFNTLTYQRAKEDLIETANKQGYIKATIVDNQIVVDLASNQLNIIIHVQTGDRYYFGEVRLMPNVFDPGFLRRTVSLNPDKHFSSQKLITLQQAMQGSPYFSQVALTPDFEQAQDNHVPINVSVLPPKSKKYSFGVGYGTYTGPRVSAGLNWRNITDTGQHLDAQLRLSSVISGLEAKYYIPGQDPLTDQWYLGANVKLFTPKNTFSKSSALFAGYETSIHKVKSSLNLNYLVERYRIDPDPTVVSQILYPKLNFYYVKADDLINPKNGKSLEFILQGSAQSVLSTTSFIQGEVKGKWVYSPFDWARIVTRGDLGYTAVHDIEALPATLRFYAGELNGLRGFPESSIGPGRYLMVGSLEYQQQVYKEWHGAIFYDLGRASDHLNDPFNQSTGLGILYKSMVGPLKLYAVRALHSQHKPYSIEFNIGPEFQ